MKQYQCCRTCEANMWGWLPLSLPLEYCRPSEWLRVQSTTHQPTIAHQPSEAAETHTLSQLSTFPHIHFPRSNTALALCRGFPDTCCVRRRVIRVTAASAHGAASLKESWLTRETVIPLPNKPTLLPPSPGSETCRSSVGNWSTHNTAVTSAATTEPAKWKHLPWMSHTQLNLVSWKNPLFSFFATPLMNSNRKKAPLLHL